MIEVGAKVEVFWIDAGFENSNMSLCEAGKLHPLERSNVGYLVNDKDGVVRISFGKIEDIDKDYCVASDILIIPQSLVTKIKRQEDGKD